MKAASDIYSPVSGEIPRSTALIDNPQLVNTAPYDDGWIYRMSVNDEKDLDELLNAEAYADHCSDE